MTTRPHATRALLIAVACLFLAAPWIGAARADDSPDGPSRPAPRAAVDIDGRSVVLIAGPDRIYAFVDRIDDNAPDDGSRLGLKVAGAPAALTLDHPSPGLFTAPFSHAGRASDGFDISLAPLAPPGPASSRKTVTTVASLVYEEVAPTPLPEEGWSHSWLPFHVGFAAWLLGACLSGVLGWLGHRAWARGWRAAGNQAA